jgi:hypothetical protein
VFELLRGLENGLGKVSLHWARKFAKAAIEDRARKTH